MAKSRRTSHRPARPAASKPTPTPASASAPVAVAPKPTARSRDAVPPRGPSRGQAARRSRPRTTGQPDAVVGAGPQCALAAARRHRRPVHLRARPVPHRAVVGGRRRRSSPARRCGTRPTRCAARGGSPRSSSSSRSRSRSIPGTAERFGVSKLTVLMIGALVLAALWVGRRAHEREDPRPPHRPALADPRDGRRRVARHDLQREPEAQPPRRLPVLRRLPRPVWRSRSWRSSPPSRGGRRISARSSRRSCSRRAAPWCCTGSSRSPTSS